MAIEPRVTSLPLELRGKLTELAQKVRVPAITARLVQILLPEENLATENGRADLVRIWATRQGITPEHACVDLAWQGNLITAADRMTLLQQLGTRVQTQPATDAPHWTAETGELRFGGKIVRRVRLMAERSQVQMILDAFQLAGWSGRIKNPLSDPPDQQQTHQAISWLNEGLGRIRFHAQEGASHLTWDRANSKRTRSRLK